MKFFLVALLALLLGVGSAHAQPAPSGIDGGYWAGGDCNVVTLGGSNGARAMMVDSHGNLCTAISGSVTSSVTGFTPGGTYATLTATGSSASVALPAGVTVQFQNTGTSAVSCTLGVGSATAVASELVVQAGGQKAVTVGANTFGACIDQSGSASNVVVLAGGAGLGNDTGSGPLPAGASIVGKVGIDQTTPGTTNGVQVNAALPAGANIIGKASIDQTTPGTTNGVQVNAALPAGTNNIGLVDLTGATALAPVVSGSLENAHVLKNAAGRLYSAYASNLTGGAASNLLIFNATSAPVDGAVTPIVCVPFTGGVASANYQGIPPASFGTGITAVVSSATSCFTKTTGVTTAFISGIVQ